ncbi:MAG TPA: hypothetical protein VHX63_06055 [Acidobacteriaceae bacterium]|nr:hypothetical protein [Acidobacteriaceae bacterium]
MIPTFRDDFNRRFRPELYQKMLERMDRATRTHIGFRTSETPCFFPASLVESMAEAGRALTHQLVDNPEYMQCAAAAVPERYRMPNQSRHPNFMTVDFGLARAPDGTLQPKLVELQAFPSVYAYQALLAETYADVFSLDPTLQSFLGGLDAALYWQHLKDVIVGDHDPENVILLEVTPEQQKTLPDFHVTEDHLHICTVDIAHVIKQGSQLFYRRNGRLVPIRRIYNRAIVDEIVQKQVPLPFDYRDDLDVEWAGHPNWYFLISKFSLPWLRHATVPSAVFLDDWYAGQYRDRLPEDRSQWILKPLYSFAGKGIVFEPSQQELDSIPATERHHFLLQQRVHFESVIATPHGVTQAEIRFLYVWPEQGDLLALLTLVRMGRGKMMGVDHNRNQEWVGSSAAFFPIQTTKEVMK